MVRSHTQELLAGPKPRTTCDRCHSQKLRCIKAVDQGRCLRCARHNTTCTFSPRSRRKTRKVDEADTAARASESQSSSSPALPLAAPLRPPSQPLSTCNWSPMAQQMDLAALFPTAALECAFTPAGDAAGHKAKPWATTDAVRELADLNVRLIDHFSTLPAPLKPSTDQATGSLQSRFFAIDQTFALTKALITVLKRLYLHLDDPQFDRPSIDQATTLLILSCYYRLMDIYESIGRNIQSCSQNPQMPWPGDEAVVTLPSLQIGSFSPDQLQDGESERPPSLSTVSMHMMVMLMLSSQLCEQLRDVITEGLGRTYNDQMSSFDMVGGALHMDVADIMTGGPSRIFDDSTQKDLQQRWHTLAEQFSSARQAVVLFGAASI